MGSWASASQLMAAVESRELVGAAHSFRITQVRRGRESLTTSANRRLSSISRDAWIN